MTSVNTRILTGFDDPTFGPGQWAELLASGDTDVMFLTWCWQRSWWESFGRGLLLLVVAEQSDRTFALAPLFADSGMVFFVGSGGSDYLDFIGDVSAPGVLAALLETARRQVPDFVGFRFYHVLDDSRTGSLLAEAGARLDLVCYDEGELPAPALNLTVSQEAARTTTKQSLLRHERFFRREGKLDVHHTSESASISPFLDQFFAQHRDRWERTPYPSLFHEPAQRDFYWRLTSCAGDAGWLRFTRLEWEGRPIAFHFGFCYRGDYLWYKPTFEIALARRSPGEVLLRQLLLAAMAEGARTFDFGLGDEAFKHRFATHVRRVRTWGLYPETVLQSAGDFA